MVRSKIHVQKKSKADGHSRHTKAYKVSFVQSGMLFGFRPSNTGSKVIRIPSKNLCGGYETATLPVSRRNIRVLEESVEHLDIVPQPSQFKTGEMSRLLGECS